MYRLGPHGLFAMPHGQHVCSANGGMCGGKMVKMELDGSPTPVEESPSLKTLRSTLQTLSIDGPAKIRGGELLMKKKKPKFIML